MKYWKEILAVFAFSAIFFAAGFICGHELKVHQIQQAVTIANKSTDKVTSIQRILDNNPYMRVCRINAKYRELCRKHNIDPEAEGVFN